MPQELQKCAARISPHDQQLAVVSEVVEMGAAELAKADIGLNNFATDFTFSGNTRPAGRHLAANAGLARENHQEKELPHPHDFDAFGFTNTKPCCRRVSW